MLYYNRGRAEEYFPEESFNEALDELAGRFRDARRILVVPPDFTRAHSLAGEITCGLYSRLREKIGAILPALGTHQPMSAEEIGTMFPGIPVSLFKVHNWREGTTRLGELPGSFLRELSGGALEFSWPAEVSNEVLKREYDLILSVGQVVPHEVAGMANYTKNIFVGTGGGEGIGKSHYLGAVCGIENILGQADNPVRRLFNTAADRFACDLPLVYILTVVKIDPHGVNRLYGLYAGDDDECYRQAAALSGQLNIVHLDKPIKKAVVSLDPAEFRSTWLGNKAVYRTRLAMADDGELIIIAPGVRMFGEDEAIDAVIRRYGYAGTPRVLELMADKRDLQQNLGAAAHLMHGSTEGRFRVTYCPGGLSSHEIEQVHYTYADPAEMARQYDLDNLKEGFNVLAGGEEIFYIKNPAIGLWEYSK